MVGRKPKLVKCEFCKNEMSSGEYRHHRVRCRNKYLRSLQNKENSESKDADNQTLLASNGVDGNTNISDSSPDTDALPTEPQVVDTNVVGGNVHNVGVGADTASDSSVDVAYGDEKEGVMELEIGEAPINDVDAQEVSKTYELAMKEKEKEVQISEEDKLDLEEMGVSVTYVSDIAYDRVLGDPLDEKEKERLTKHWNRIFERDFKIIVAYARYINLILDYLVFTVKRLMKIRDKEKELERLKQKEKENQKDGGQNENIV